MKVSVLFSFILIMYYGQEEHSTSPVPDRTINFRDTFDFSQDNVIQQVYGDDKPDSIISFDYQEESYPKMDDGSCESGTLITISTLTINQELKFDLVWSYLEKDQRMFSPILSFDMTPGQGEASAELSSEYALSDQCTTLAVKEWFEGGDIDLSRSSRIVFFAIDNGVLSEILSVQLEDTHISEYYASGNENLNSSSIRAEIEVLETSTNGYKDLKVTFIETTDGEETSNEDKIYRFGVGGYK